LVKEALQIEVASRELEENEPGRKSGSNGKKFSRESQVCQEIVVCQENPALFLISHITH
jgi:hypothetical protein